jgi:hypothetical protein
MRPVGVRICAGGARDHGIETVLFLGIEPPGGNWMRMGHLRGARPKLTVALTG